MNNKAAIVTAVIASILVVGMISPIGPVYAHVNVCSSSNDHDKDGIPFSALWAAVCDLQSQIDGLQNQINNLQGGGQSSVVTKEVQLTPATGCAKTPDTYFVNGYCPDSTSSLFFIKDAAVGNNSVIDVSSVNPPGGYAPAQCSVTTINLVEGPDMGFVINCSTAPTPTTLLNYIIFNPSTSNTCTSPQVLQNGVCVTPPVVCTPPKVLDKTTNTCITPTQNDDKDKKQGNDSQFTNYKNENKH